MSAVSKSELSKYGFTIKITDSVLSSQENFCVRSQPKAVLYIRRYRNQTLFSLPLRSNYPTHASATLRSFWKSFRLVLPTPGKIVPIHRYVRAGRLGSDSSWLFGEQGFKHALGVQACSRCSSMFSVFPKERTAFTQRVSIASQN
jgi:hypothetical protein